MVEDLKKKEQNQRKGNKTEDEEYVRVVEIIDHKGVRTSEEQKKKLEAKREKDRKYETKKEEEEEEELLSKKDKRSNKDSKKKVVVNEDEVKKDHVYVVERSANSKDLKCKKKFTRDGIDGAGCHCSICRQKIEREARGSRKKKLVGDQILL